MSDARVAHLATASADGRPHVVPCVFAIEGETIYSPVDHKPKRSRELARVRNVRANPRVALLVDAYGDDWSALWWVRVDGAGRVIDEGTEFDRAATLLTAKYPQYTAHPIAGPMIAIDAERWSGWSA